MPTTGVGVSVGELLLGPLTPPVRTGGVVGAPIPTVAVGRDVMYEPSVKTRPASISLLAADAMAADSSALSAVVVGQSSNTPVQYSAGVTVVAMSVAVTLQPS